ncbi:hypothetical protein HPB50_015147 [Hyalomma asiaticum]|uniref:Uncharacterized protein n=1 Tax=Hyalomma asiaticum TaxID=266040 RepID=A0ACB7T534_HYAAI|nr:hypothetical protein HPB50_015147 [Hyalomma asiaticum]
MYSQQPYFPQTVAPAPLGSAYASDTVAPPAQPAATLLPSQPVPLSAPQDHTFEEPAPTDLASHGPHLPEPMDLTKNHNSIPHDTPATCDRGVQMDDKQVSSLLAAQKAKWKAKERRLRKQCFKFTAILYFTCAAFLNCKRRYPDTVSIEKGPSGYPLTRLKRCCNLAPVCHHQWVQPQLKAQWCRVHLLTPTQKRILSYLVGPHP